MSTGMKLTKTPDGYVVQVPDDVVTALGLHEGDYVKVVKGSDDAPRLSEARKNDLIAEIRALARPLPPGYVFDRDEANARR